MVCLKNTFIYLFIFLKEKQNVVLTIWSGSHKPQKLFWPCDFTFSDIGACDAFLVMHFAQCGAVCVTTYWCVSRDASGMQKNKTKKNTEVLFSYNTRGTKSWARFIFSVFYKYGPHLDAIFLSLW